MKVEWFNLRKEEHYDKYYPILEKWWKDWDFQPMTPNLLSQNGLMVSNEGVNICAGWVFVTDSDFAFVGWLISNKEEKELRKGCIEYLLVELEKLAVKLGVKVTMSPAKNQFLKKKLEKLGHNEFVDYNINNYFKRI